MFHVCFKSLLRDYVDTRQFLHKPLSMSTGMTHKYCNSSYGHLKFENCLHINHVGP